MPTIQTKNIQELEEKISSLEKLFFVHLKQEEDWVDEPVLVKKLDQIAQSELSIRAEDVGL